MTREMKGSESTEGYFCARVTHCAAAVGRPDAVVGRSASSLEAPDPKGRFDLGCVATTGTRSAPG
jgi:hypothetical protein